MPELLVAHFGVPLAHLVLVAINTRLSGPEIGSSTGKIQKYVLREQVWAGRDRRIH